MLGARHWPLAALLLAYLGETFGLSLTSATDGAIISGLESALKAAAGPRPAKWAIAQASFRVAGPSEAIAVRMRCGIH